MNWEIAKKTKFDAASMYTKILEGATLLGKEYLNVIAIEKEFLDQMNMAFKHSALVISNISTTYSEQMQGIEQINSAISSLDQSTQENAVIAAQTSEIATQTASMSSSLVEETSKNKF